MKSHASLLISIFLMFSFIFPCLSAESDPPLQRQNSIVYDEETRFSLKNAIEELNIGGYMFVDGRLFLGENQNKSTFLIPRARLYFAGNLYNLFDFMLMASWDRLENSTMTFAWLQTSRPSWAQILVGLFKVPFSLEALYFDIYLTFAERSLVVRNLHRIDDIGIMVHGELFNKAIGYGIGFFNGRELRIDNNNNKEFVGRLVFAFSPLLASKDKLYVGFSGEVGRHDEILSETFFSTGSDTIFWRWTDDPLVTEHSTRLSLGTDFEWFKGPLYVCAEYLYADWGHINKGYHQEHFWGYGGYGEVSYLLTGEDKPRNHLLIPKHNFNGCNQWGAWEIAARYEVFHAPKRLIKSGFAVGANKVHGPTVAVNWYLNPSIIVRLNGQYLWFNRPILINSHRAHYESIIICRVQGLF